MIQFDEATHTYTRNGSIYTSVTTLLKNYGLSANYTGIPKDVLSKAASRGHATHKALENYIKLGTKDPNDIDLCNFEKYVVARSIDLTLAKSEEIIYDDQYLLAGTVDFQYTDNDEEVIADFKTTAQIHWESVAWQLSIYNFMKCKGDVIKYYLKHLKVFHMYNGKLTVREVPTIEYDEIVKLLTANLNNQPYIYAPDLSGIMSSSEGIMLKTILDDIEQCEILLKDLTKKKEEMTSKLTERMINANKHSVDVEGLRLIYSDTSVRKSLDAAKVKQFCDLYNIDVNNLYKTTVVNSRLTVKKI